MSVKLVYKDIAVGADEDATITATGQEANSLLALVPFGSGNETEYTTLEHNMWSLSGGKQIYDGGVFSFWSDEISDENGYFSITPEITATMDEQYNSLGVFLRFGVMNYCSEVEVLWYQGNSLLSQKTFYPDAFEYYCDNRVDSYSKVVVRLVRTSHPYQRARLDALIFGITRTFKRDELRSVKVTEQVNLISKELPENVLDWQLNSATVVDYLFQLKQPVRAYNGDALVGVFYVKTSNRKSARVYDISCTDAIGVLDEEKYPDVVLTSKNAFELARDICGDFEVEMDSALQSKTVTGVLSKQTRRQALQQLCFAIGAVADTSGVETIRIFVPQTSEAKEIPTNRVRVGGSVKRADAVTSVQLTAHSYSTSASNGGTVEINGVKYYDTPTVYTMDNPNATTADKKNVISIADATLISSGNVQEILQRVFDFYMLRDTHNVSFRLEGEKMGDYVSTPTSWGDMVTGNYTRATITLSGIAVANAEVIGSE